MKIVLEAFGGRLRSEPMDWPEGAPTNVRLAMDMDVIGGAAFTFTHEDLGNPPRLVVGIFVATNRYYPFGRHEAARIYQLVEVLQ